MITKTIGKIYNYTISIKKNTISFYYLYNNYRWKLVIYNCCYLEPHTNEKKVQIQQIQNIDFKCQDNSLTALDFSNENYKRINADEIVLI